MTKLQWKMLHAFDNFVAAWISLAVAIVYVCTLGFYRPWWDFDFCVYVARRNRP